MADLIHSRHLISGGPLLGLALSAIFASSCPQAPAAANSAVNLAVNLDDGGEFRVRHGEGLTDDDESQVQAQAGRHWSNAENNGDDEVSDQAPDEPYPTVESESAQSEPTQPEPAQPEFTQPESTQPESAQPESTQDINATEPQYEQPVEPSQAYEEQGYEAQPEQAQEANDGLPLAGEDIKPTVDSKKDIARDKQEEESLKKLVKELEYGSLANSIIMLEKLTKTYPLDSDYTGLLNAARNLKDGDIWYRYQSRLQQAPKEKEKVVAPLAYTIKPATVRINDLKHSSWLLMYKKLGSGSSR